MDRTLTLLVGLIGGGIVIWLIVRALQNKQVADSSGFVGNNISNSTVIIGGDTRQLASIPLPARGSARSANREFSMPALPAPRNDITSTAGITLTTAGRPVVTSRSGRTNVTITNGSGANIVRIGSKAEIERGEGAIVPPHGVVSFPVRAQTELWARANGNTQTGVIVSPA